MTLSFGARSLAFYSPYPSIIGCSCWKIIASWDIQLPTAILRRWGRQLWIIHSQKSHQLEGCKGLVKKSGQGPPHHLLHSLIAIHSEIQKIPRTLVNFSQTGKGHLWYQQVKSLGWNGWQSYPVAFNCIIPYDLCFFCLLTIYSLWHNVSLTYFGALNSELFPLPAWKKSCQFWEHPLS